MILPDFAVEGQMIDDAADGRITDAVLSKQHICRTAVDDNDYRIADTRICHIEGYRLIPCQFSFLIDLIDNHQLLTLKSGVLDRGNNVSYDSCQSHPIFGRMPSTSSCGDGMTWQP